MPKKITPATKNRVVVEYRMGVPLREISETENLSQTTILKIVKESETELRDGGTHKDKVSEVNRLYLEGLPILDIMALTGIKSQQTIYRMLLPTTKRRRNR